MQKQLMLSKEDSVNSVMEAWIRMKLSIHCVQSALPRDLKKILGNGVRYSKCTSLKQKQGSGLRSIKLGGIYQKKQASSVVYQ